MFIEYFKGSRPVQTIEISLKCHILECEIRTFPDVLRRHDIISSVEFHESLSENTKRISRIPFLERVIPSI